jgi:ligand-binding SRPBCC domain-containing protein
MKIYVCSPPIPQSVQTIQQGFNEALFKALNPPWMPMKVVHFGGCTTGDTVVLRLGPAFLPMMWESLITQHGQTDHSFWFIDEGTRLPFFLKSWKHLHYIRETEEGTVIVDDIHLTFSSFIFWPMVFLIRYQMAYRKKAYLRFFNAMRA